MGDDDFEPSLPYAGTEGASGSDTSYEEANRQVVEGIASIRQRYILICAQRAGERGVTVAELRDSRLHHGRVSGSLSVLHKEGRLCRLRERRDKCKVYVLPEHVNGRETEVHGRRSPVPTADEETLGAAAYLEHILTRNQEMDALFDMGAPDDKYTLAIWRLVNYAQGRT